MDTITPCLWFDTESEEAAAFYTSIFEDSRIVEVGRYNEAGPRPAGTVMVVAFEINGQRFTALNGGPEFKHSEAISSRSPATARRRSTTTGRASRRAAKRAPAAGSRTASASRGRSSRSG